MAIVIPSKSLYSPIENEKVRTPIGSVSISQLYSDKQDITFLKRVTGEGDFEEVLMPYSDYFKRTLNADGNIVSLRVDYHIGDEENKNYESFYETFEDELDLYKIIRNRISFDRDETNYLVSLSYRIFEGKDGLSYSLGAYASRWAQSTSNYQEDITIDSVQISFRVSVVKRDFQEETVKFGNGSKDVFSIPSNELLQSSAIVDRGFNGIRYYGIEAGEVIADNTASGEGITIKYNTLQGNDISSLSTVNRGLFQMGYYYSDGKTVLNVYNLSENTEINKHNADFIRDVGFYWGIDNDEIPCTYSFMEDLLSVYIDSEIDLSLGFRVVLDFGEGGWLKTENLSNVIAKGVLEQYGKGKETARIRCSTNDYYYENGDLAISPTGKNELPMLFSINDEVIPMVTPDRAMSYYKDETPKVFRVVGVRFENRGALWQELTLQEK